MSEIRVMTGPEHYAEARRLLRYAGGDPVVIAEAQVHATLALVMVAADKS